MLLKTDSRLLVTILMLRMSMDDPDPEQRHQKLFFYHSFIYIHVFFFLIKTLTFIEAIRLLKSYIMERHP